MSYGNPQIGDDMLDGRDLASQWRDLTLGVVDDDDEEARSNGDQTLDELMEDDDDARELFEFAQAIYDDLGFGIERDPESIFESMEDGLIHDSYFVEYAQQLADDIGAVQGEGWPNGYIDWERAARDLKMDYSSVDFKGHTYWTRSC